MVELVVIKHLIITVGLGLVVLMGLRTGVVVEDIQVAVADEIILI